MKIGKIIAQGIERHHKGNIGSIGLSNIPARQGVGVDSRNGLTKVDVADLCVDKTCKKQSATNEDFFHNEVVRFIEIR